MEPAEYRPDDRGRVLLFGDPGEGAAMEPAEYRPDDRPGDYTPATPEQAAMEPAEYRPDDHRNREMLRKYTDAAMEPAEYRPDDGGPGMREARTRRAPQWSRPSIGRMTHKPRLSLCRHPCRNGAGRVSAG